MRTALSMLAIITLIPGCAKQSKEKNKAVLPQKQAAFSFDSIETNIDLEAASAYYSEYSQIEAQLNDIPTMVGFVQVEIPTLHSMPEGQMVCAFASDLDQGMITNFYQFEMERQGWQRMSCIKNLESTLVFQRPKKICIISIRSLSKRTKNNYKCLVHICTSFKEK